MTAQKQTGTAIEKTEKKSLVNKDGSVTDLVEWATSGANSVEALEELFGSEGVAYSTGGELTGDFQVVSGDLKQVFLGTVGCGKPVFVIKWRFQPGDTGEFVTMHMLIEGVGKVILNDGSKGGMYGQLSHITAQRLSDGIDKSRACAGLKVQRGIVRNAEYEYDKRTNKAIKRGDDVPSEFRAKANPSWRFDI